MVKKQPFSRGAINLETIAVSVVILLVVLVTVAIIALPRFSKQSALKPPVDTLPQPRTDVASQRQDVAYIDPKGPFVQDDPASPDAKPVNEKLFDENKPIYASFDYKIHQTRFIGRILEIDRSNGLTMQMSSLLGNSLGAKVTYHFDPAVLARITITGNSPESLAIGQEINIDETNDYTKTYQDSIQAIDISTR